MVDLLSEDVNTHLNSSAKLNRRSSSMSPMVGFRWLLKAASVV